MSFKVTLEADGEVLDLDEITMNGAGMEAVSGMTGLGLPPVDVQWFEGAGDGARARNVRVTPRDLDIPIHVFADSRADLRAIVAKIARVVSKTMTLKVYDDDDNPDSYKYTQVVRTGGGTYVYGSDTDGEREWNTILTVRAGNPYWLYDTVTTATYVGAPQLNASKTIVNPGTAKAYPRWYVMGPCDHFSATSPDGDVLEWFGRINQGEALTIDTETASVVDDNGVNRYSGLSVAPTMWKLDPGSNTFNVLTEVNPTVARTNYAKYGDFSTSTHGFTPATANTLLSVAGGRLVLTPKIAAGQKRPTEIANASTTITGLPPQEELVIRLTLGADRAPDYWPTYVSFSDGGFYIIPNGQTQADVVHEFTVPDNGQITAQVRIGGAKTASGAVKWLSGFVDNLYVGLAGTPFTGDTPDNATYRYDWTGTAHQSTSTETLLAAQGNVAVDLSFTPRDWQVI